MSSKITLTVVKKEIHEWNEVLLKIPGFNPNRTIYKVDDVEAGLLIGWFTPLNAKVVKKSGKTKKRKTQQER